MQIQDSEDTKSVAVTFEGEERRVAEVAAGLMLLSSVVTAGNHPLLFSEPGRKIMAQALREFIVKRGDT